MKASEAMRLIAEALTVEPDEINEYTTSSDVATWDSTGNMSLTAMLDEVFGIELSMEDMQQIKSVGDILNILRKNGKVIK